MTALSLLWLAAAPCFAPSDGTAGWKQVALPEDAPSLAAPLGCQQFRSGERVSVVDERTDLFLAGTKTVLGRTSFDFVLGSGGHSLELRFAHPLRGAKVDVTAFGAQGMLQLMNEERVAGDRLSLTWGNNEVSAVTVRVHGHLRQAPTVQSYRAVRRVSASSLHESETFGLVRSLYYLQPPGAPVTLCDEPSLLLTVSPGSPAASARPSPVSLRRLAPPSSP
jgi:hypothetical protein